MACAMTLFCFILCSLTQTKEHKMNSTDRRIQDENIMQAFKDKLKAEGEAYGKGLGETYAFGYLSAMVQDMMARYPEVRAEIESALASK